MDEVIPKQPSTIRKSAFGRTSLFLPSNDVLLREIQCMGGVTRHDNVSIYHSHNTEGKKIDCWHCCESFEGKPVQVPRLYDPTEKVYHVYGNFCSANCGKAFILENTTYDRGQHLNVFVKMLREVYGITQKVIEAPPRISLEKFGGPFNIKSFRTMENICSICKPPFVSYCMVVEERSASKASDKHELYFNNKVILKEDADIPDTPPDPLYNDFMKRKSEGQSSSDVAMEDVEKNIEKSTEKQSKTRKRKSDKASSSNSINTLANY